MTALLLLALAAPAQVIGGEWRELYPMAGSLTDERYGVALDGGKDFDLDGHADLLVGALWGSATGAPRFGIVEVHSVASGALLATWSVGATNGGFGCAVAWIDDLDNDGIPDAIVGARELPVGSTYGAGKAFAISGATGLPLHEIQGSATNGHLGESLAVIGDVDADGWQDYAVGEPWVYTSAGQGRVHVVSGVSGNILYALDGSGQFGAALGSCDDLDLDGRPELLIGSPLRSGTAGGYAGAVEIRSGATGVLLRLMEGGATNARFGSGVCSVHDADRDGRRDILVGAPNAFPGSYLPFGAGFVHSSRTGALLRSHMSLLEGGDDGEDVAEVGDMDADGVADYVVVAPGSQLVTARVFSGRNGRPILEYGCLPLRPNGANCRGVGDASGDGRADLAIGLPYHDFYHNNTYVGQVSLIGLDPYLRSTPTLIPAAAGAFVRLDLQFPSHAGDWRYRVLFSAAGPGRTMIGVPVPLMRDRLLEQTWTGSYPSVVPITGMTGVLDPSGFALATAQFAPGAASAWIGRTFALAAVATPPGQQLPQISSAFTTWTIQ